jgi:very-short-patch-repair endonuclease
VDVSVPVTRRAALRPPARVHRIGDLRPQLAVQRSGLRLTDPVRTIIDLGLTMSMWSVERAIVRSVGIKLVTLEQIKDLRAALGRPGRNGTGVVRHIFEERARTLRSAESVLELEFGRMCDRHDLPHPVLQFEVWAGGRFVARVDAAYPEVKLAIELDGFEAHTSPEVFQRDRQRQNELVALGWTVLRFTWADITRDAARVAGEILRTRRRLAAA